MSSSTLTILTEEILQNKLSFWALRIKAQNFGKSVSFETLFKDVQHMEEIILELLKKDRLFGKLESEKIFSWLNDGKIRIMTLMKGEKLMTSEDTSSCLVIVISGCIIVSKINAQGKETIFNYHSSGAIFGMTSIFGSEHVFPSVMTCKQQSKIAIIPKCLIEQAFRENYDFAKEYASLLTDKILFLNEKLSAYTESDTEGKLLSWIKSASESTNEITIPSGGISHLAKALGMGRASLYRALDKLEKEGMILRSGDKITIISTQNKS